MSDRKKVLLTGATGNCGSKIRDYLLSKNRYDLILVDIDPRGDPCVVSADLSVYDESWAVRFEGVDVVVHMAGNPRQDAPWERLEKQNIDAVINVYEAAVAKGSKRVVFASSVTTMYGHLQEAVNITIDLPTHPINLYGATKVMGERLGKSYAERHGISVVCLRMGWNRHGANRPGPDMGEPWTQQLWLSNEDLCQAVEKAIVAKDIKYEVLNLLSNNAGMRWDLSETRRVLGYEPQDEHVPVPLRSTKRLAKWLRRQARRLV